MRYNERYWNGKEDRAKKAQEHTKRMAEVYLQEIKDACEQTKLYENSNVTYRSSMYKTQNNMMVVDKDSVTAIFDHHEGKTAVLNFASYKNPGGKFIDGSSAQEESLCHESFLYNVLSTKEDYYAWNRSHLNYALYLNRALYTPNVVFERNGKIIKCDVLTCAAPNYSAYSKYHPGQKNMENNNHALYDRLAFIKAIVEQEHVNTFILGAFGCGVFRQDSVVVAKYMNYLFADTEIKNIIYAVPKGSDLSNYEAFSQIIRRHADQG